MASRLPDGVIEDSGKGFWLTLVVLGLLVLGGWFSYLKGKQDAWAEMPPVQILQDTLWVAPPGCALVNSFEVPDTTRLLWTLTCPIGEEPGG